MRRSSPIRCTVTTRRYFPSAPARSTSPARGASSTSASSPEAGVLYVGYNSALASTFEFASVLERFSGEVRAVRRVIVDVRLNGGGNNQSYRPLYSVLASPRINRPGRLYLLVGRATFSAAGNFAAEIDRYTRAVLVGEPTGGGVNQYGDATTITLPATGWEVHVATSYVVRGRPTTSARDRPITAPRPSRCPDPRRPRSGARGWLEGVERRRPRSPAPRSTPVAHSYAGGTSEQSATRRNSIPTAESSRDRYH